MRQALIAAALVTAACTNDPAVDPAWVTPGTAGECSSGGPDLPANMAGSYAALWQCRGGGVNGDLPCDPDANPLLGDDEIALTVDGSGYTLAVADQQLALRVADPMTLASDIFMAGDYRMSVGVTSCAEGKLWLAVSATSIDDATVGYGWAATLTRL